MVCAIDILPVTSWINEQQKSMFEDDWNTIADDHQYYQSMAAEIIENKIIKVFTDEMIGGI